MTWNCLVKLADALLIEYKSQPDKIVFILEGGDH